ncbi:MAG TPA: YeeE/YedE thiosulfate transporter family protein [Methylomirabilota bacterium]|nr:YeeE/YedE thiosulfate transporter family protein [Methylomirabilota bacterium]
MIGPALRAQWQALAGRSWPVWGAALLVATVNVFLFAFDRPWTASDGLRNWGDWVFTGLGLTRRPDLLPPWLYSGSLLNLGVLLGATGAALCAREFAIRVPPAGELVKGAAGGALMGVGATLAFGCNIGGFFSAISALSLAGLGMMLGLGVGAFLGLRYLLWETERRPGWSSGRARIWGAAAGDGASVQPLAGVLVLLALVAAPFAYAAAGFPQRGVFLLFGVAFGVIFQRSRFCLVRAFREPFFTGDAEHTRAAALALVVSTLGFAILKFADLKDKGDWVFAAAGIGSLLGGTLFGVGMTLAGGCGAGSIWRAGEGQVKLWAAVACFALAASAARLILAPRGVLSRLGVAVFLPAALGWSAALLLVVAVAAAWALAATWNEDARKFTALD